MLTNSNGLKVYKYDFLCHCVVITFFFFIEKYPSSVVPVYLNTELVIW